MNHHIAGMPPSLSMSRGRNMYFPCGPGMEPHHMQRGPYYPMPDEKMGMPPGMPYGMMGEFKSPHLEPPAPPSGSSKKKRRTSAATPAFNPSQAPHQGPAMQDLMPQQPSTLGDTIVASNPFDDAPPPSSSVGMMSHPMHMGPGPGPMGMSPMHSPHHMNIGPPMSSPMNNMHGSMVSNPLSSPLGSPHMMGMVNGGGPGQHMMVSPAMSPMSMMNNNPMTSPHAASPIMGSPHLGMNGPLGSPMNCGGPTPSPNSCSVNVPCSGPCPSVSVSGPGPNNNCMPNMSNCSPCSPNVPCGPSCGPRMSMGPRMMGPQHPGVGPGPGHPGHNPMSHMHMLGMGPKPLPVSAGKIYPHDQPMVFNPQNPNAPPIYPCGICHKEVHDNDQAILCESGCNFWFHRMCTGLGEPAYQLLTAEVYAEWVCDKCLNSKNIPLVKFKP